MGVAVAGSEEFKSPIGARNSGRPAIAPPDVEPFHIDGLLLLSPHGGDTTQVDGITLTFDDQGVGVIRVRGESPRILPWSSLATHVIEPWTGDLEPEWWVDPELNRTANDNSKGDAAIDPRSTSRPPLHAAPGALISLQTPFATYRFLLPGGRVEELTPRIAALALSHQGPAGAPSVTTVVPGPSSNPKHGHSRRGDYAAEQTTTTWSKVQPILVIALSVFLVTAATLVLLQSAGTIHLPYLGGANPGVISSVSRR
jgi:hypothetical protein